jgi:hypothetical protein
MMTRHALAFAAILAAAGPAAGATLGDGLFTVSGYGGWAWGKTSANDYLHGDPASRWDNATFALAVIAQPDDRLQVAAQLFFSSRAAVASDAKVDLDWAFATWRFSDALALRVGKVRQPFGIYGEIYDVGTLRPFLSLPQGIYGPAGFMGESYEGFGVTGDLPLRGGWSIAYDAYLGEMVTPKTLVAEEVANPALLVVEAGADEAQETHGHHGGARLTVHPPVDGLSLRLTASAGSDGHRVGGVSVDYATDTWLLRSEGFYLQDGAALFAWAGYVEAARRFGKVELALRADGSFTHPAGYRGDSTVMQHRDLALGVGYWLSPQLVIRAAAHTVYGNRFAYPAADFDAVILAGTLQPRTLLFEAGAQFAF